MAYSGMATQVKQFYTEASSTLRTAIGGSTRQTKTVMLKGVTINPSAAAGHVEIFDGETDAGTKIYEWKGGSAAGDTYQEYIAATGIRAIDGLYIKLTSNITSVGIIWQ